MDHSVRIEALPDGLTFPSEFRDRIHFDPSSRRLIYRGFMSKEDFDRLAGLSENWSYRRSLEDLFRQCLPESSHPPRGLLRAFSSLKSFWMT